MDETSIKDKTIEISHFIRNDSRDFLMRGRKVGEAHLSPPLNKPKAAVIPMRSEESIDFTQILKPDIPTEGRNLV